MTIQATPARIHRTGEWGARIEGVSPLHPILEGILLTITTRAGKSWQARVGEIVWESDDGSVVVVTTTPLRSQGRATSRDPSAPRSSSGCTHCRWTPARTTQLWEECDYCGHEPVHM